MRIAKVFVSGCIDLSGRTAVGILAFEAAAAMARLVSLHRTLADDHFLPLCDNMRSLGVAKFFSTDQSFLRLSCAELISELDTVAAATVSRFSHKCRDPLLRDFARFYGNVKAGALGRCHVAEVDRHGLGTTAKSVENQIKKMEKYVAATSRLQEELLKLEESEKAQDSKQRKHGSALEIRDQRLNVRRLKKESLWSRTFDQVVQAITGAVVTVFARICAVFCPHVLSSPPDLPPAQNHGRIFPLPGAGLNFFNKLSSRLLNRPSLVEKDVPIPIQTLPSLEAGPSTVGGSGLASRYAKLITRAEFLLDCWKCDDTAGLMATKASRDDLYQMMTPCMQRTLREKLKEIRRRRNDGAETSSMETNRWRNELERILGWLGPLAGNTSRWEEKYDERRFLVGPLVLLSQTLHYADRNSTESAIVVIFAALSCLCWTHEQTQQHS